MTAALVRVERVGWRAGASTILDNVTLEVGDGEFVAILGKNGAGKSSLLDIIAGLRGATNGTVMLAGKAVEAWSFVERARLLAHLPQTVRGDLSIRAGA